MSAVGETRELGCTLPSGGIGREPNGRAGTIRIIVQSVNRHCYSSASLPDGTVLVACSRQPFLDAARVLIAAGHDPNSWLEGWRPGSMAFALRARLGIAAGLTIDETRTVFAKWKPFSSSAVSSSARLPGGAATTLARRPKAATGDVADSPDQRRRPRTGTASEETDTGA